MSFPTMEDLSWVPSSFQILKTGGGYISGIVNSEEELQSLLENHKRVTLTYFTKWSDNSKDSSKLRHLWQVEDYCDDTPLCVTKRVILACQRGRAACRRPSTAKEHSPEHVNTKRGPMPRTWKLDCPAKLFIRHVKRYDTFSVKGNASRATKEDAMKRLKQELAQTDPPTSTIIHVKIPLMEAHQNHSIDSGCYYSRPIHPKVRDKIQEMAGMGITSVAFVKKALKKYVLTDLCAHDPHKPHKEDQAYFPSNTTIQNHIHMALGAGCYSALDQGNLENMVDEYVGLEDMEEDTEEEEEEGEEEGEERIVDGHGGKVNMPQHIKSAKLAFREELRKLTGYSYLCEDLETFERSTEVLKNLRKSFVTQCTRENGLMLNKQHKTVKKK